MGLTGCVDRIAAYDAKALSDLAHPEFDHSWLLEELSDSSYYSTGILNIDRVLLGDTMIVSLDVKSVFGSAISFNSPNFKIIWHTDDLSRVHLLPADNPFDRNIVGKSLGSSTISITVLYLQSFLFGTGGFRTIEHEIHTGNYTVKVVPANHQVLPEAISKQAEPNVPN